MLHTIKRRLADWRRYRRAVAQLNALDDHLLADIGMERSRIRHAARGDRR